jgi:thiamine biosynthesis lipoprotein
MKKKWMRSSLYMDTIVSLTVITARPEVEVDERMIRAFEAFRSVEDICSRFDHQSELMRLVGQVGTPVKVSNLLFEALRFSWEVAKLTHGVFDPTIGHKLETYGFQRHYLTGEIIDSGITFASSVCYQDIILDEEARTVCLQKPLVLDLGAVAKGLAVDLAARELSQFEGFVIDAGGDIYASGQNERVEPWVIGIQHPQNKAETIGSLRLSDTAICTSGSYERVSPTQEQVHHLILPQSGTSSSALISCTVIAPFAMMADAFSTAAFLLGPEDGLALLEQVGLDGVLVTPSLEVHMTKRMEEYLV